MKLPLSVFIITKNEEVRLPRTLDAVLGWAGEIIVVDSGSTDRAVEIAHAYGARVIQRSWPGYGPQKRFAEQQCRYDWVFNIDADEVVTAELAREIKRLFDGGALTPAAYRVRILTVYPGQSKPRRWANDYDEVRLYHRDVGSYRNDPVYDCVEIGELQPRQIRAPIHHFTHISITHVVEKALAFSGFRARASKPGSRALLEARLFLEFPLAFLKAYIGRRHFTGGWRGFYFSICQAFMRTTRIAKMLAGG
jgi:glycosyltransferase involved in cell wall biosynthesis